MSISNNICTQVLGNGTAILRFLFQAFLYKDNTVLSRSLTFTATGIEMQGFSFDYHQLVDFTHIPERFLSCLTSLSFPCFFILPHSSGLGFVFIIYSDRSCLVLWAGLKIITFLTHLS